MANTNVVRRTVTFVLKLLVAALLTLALLEGGLRVVGFQTLAARRSPPRDPADLHSEPFVAEAQRRGWIPWPRTSKRIDPVPEHPRGYIEMTRNEASCREDDPTPRSKAPGSIRILSLGDSHTDGTGFNDESFVNRLEAWSRDQRDAPPIEGVNAGFGPSSPYQQWWAYDRVYRKFRPDELIVVYYAGNDLLELLREDDRVHLTELDGELVHAEPTAAPDVTRTTHLRWERARQLLRDSSALYAALTDVPLLRRLVRRTVNDAYRERLERAMELHPAPVWQGLNQAYLFKHQPQRRAEAARRLRYVLEHFRDAALADGVHFTLVVLPTLRQVQPEVDEQGLRESIAILELDEADLRADVASCDLAAGLAKELGIDCLDLREPFQAAARRAPDQPLYFRFDHHLNPAGQIELAKLLDERRQARIARESPNKPGTESSDQPEPDR